MTRQTVPALLLVSVLALAGCRGEADVAPAPGGDVVAPTPAASAWDRTPPVLVVGDQAIVDGRLIVSGVAVAADALVVVHLDESGVPGDIVGATAVGAGSSTDVTIDVTGVGEAAAVWVMLHEDRGVIGTLDFPGPDVPLRGADGAVVMTPVTLTP